MVRRIPNLETKRLMIRELNMDDLEGINRILNKALKQEISIDKRRPWLQWTVLGYDMFSMLGQPPYGERGVILKETMEMIGAVGVMPCLDRFNFDDSINRSSNTLATPEVGLFWAIDPTHQNRGYGTECASAMIDYLFKHEKLGRIIATTDYENQPSQKVMKKLGMTVLIPDHTQLLDQQILGVLENKSTYS